MQIGMIGLGRMGASMATRLLSAMRHEFGGHVDKPAAGPPTGA